MGREGHPHRSIQVSRFGKDKMPTLIPNGKTVEREVMGLQKWKRLLVVMEKVGLQAAKK